MSTTTSGEHEDHTFLAHHFYSHKQQFDAGKLGMWLFLAQEVLFFSGLFCAYAIYRANHPEIFAYADHFLDRTMGAANTAVLIFSSFTMAWAVRCAQLNQRRGSALLLAITFVCACVFLCVKYVEYSHKFHMGLLWGKHFNPTLEHVAANLGAMPSNLHIFFGIYFVMTGLHAIHVIVGMGIIAWIFVRTLKGHFSSSYFGPVEYTGLYWHLVDLIWIYLFPLLYLIH